MAPARTGGRRLAWPASGRGAPERDPANELYDRACDLLDAAQALRTAAYVRGSSCATAPTLGCLEAAIDEVVRAVAKLGGAAFGDGARQMPESPSISREAGRVRAVFAQLERDLRRVRSSCASAREVVGPYIASGS